MDKRIAFITAGGHGERMHEQTPKQFLCLNNVPIIVYTLKKFEQSDSIDVILVVCLSGWVEQLKEMAVKYNITKLVAVVEGGNNSQESISNGIRYLLDNGYDGDDIVMVHESVRPFVTEKIISDNISTCLEKSFKNWSKNRSTCCVLNTMSGPLTTVILERTMTVWMPIHGHDFESIVSILLPNITGEFKHFFFCFFYR